MLKILKVECFSRQTYHKHQRNYLIPVVIKMWKEEQDKVIESMSNLEGGVVLSGDGRSDSPGHCAKYGAFTVIEQRVNKVLDIQLVQVHVSASCLFNDIFTFAVNTCHKHYVMSLCSLMKCETVPGTSTKGFFVWNDFWLPKGLQLDVIITDRNRQNAAYIPNNMKPKGTTHYYDIWHNAKGKYFSHKNKFLHFCVTVMARQRHSFLSVCQT